MVLSIDRWVGKVAIVTGASSGIGAAIVDSLVELGLIVVGVARRSGVVEKRAKQLSGKKGKLHAFKADVGNKEDVLKLFDWTLKNLGPVHVLVNNAGRGAQTHLADGSYEDWKAVLDLNVLGLSLATREAIRIMKENKINGHIIHINSVLGHHVLDVQDMGIYTASKFAVTAMTETLRRELNDLGLKIKITSVSPGLVETEMTTLSETKTERRKKFLEAAPILEGEDIADGVVYALSTPEHVQVHELTIKPVGEKF